MFIKLHFPGNNDIVYVCKNQICAIYPDQRDNNDTIVQFCGEEENYVFVKESPEEIIKMIEG